MSKLDIRQLTVRPVVLAISLCAIGAAAAAGQENGNATAAAAPQSRATPEGRAAMVPLGDLAGAQQDKLAAQIENPKAGDAHAIENGKQLFSTMNCAACHGYDAKGAMGPDLTDTYWKYGGTPVMIYKSIFEGRPEGMPSWQSMLPTDPIWDIVAYIQSLGGTFPADKYEQAQVGDLSRGNTRSETTSSPEERGRR
jgi:cytochrome c oxidase cbb3-type subunit III